MEEKATGQAQPIDNFGAFDFEGGAGSEGEVPMGALITDNTVSAAEAAILEEKSDADLKQFNDFAQGMPSLVFDKKDIAHFIELVGYHSRLGYDNYTVSFKLDTKDYATTGKVRLVYNNGNVMCTSDVPVKMNGNIDSCVLAVSTFLKVFSASRGYMFIYEVESNLYGYVFGGKVYLETYKLELDICSKEHMMEQLSAPVASSAKAGGSFIPTLKMLYDIVKTGTRKEEKAIYFEKDFAYTYSGIVMGSFAGIGLDITLQDVDISTLSKFFFDVSEQVSITDHTVFVKYSVGDRCVYLGKRGLTLSDDMKSTPAKTDGGVMVPVSKVQTIVNFLIGMANNTGVLNINSNKRGLTLVCFQKAMNDSSEFVVDGTVIGSGIQGVKVPLDILKLFLKVFKSDITLETNRGNLYIKGAEGCLVILGEE